MLRRCFASNCFETKISREMPLVNSGPTDLQHRSLKEVLHVAKYTNVRLVSVYTVIRISWEKVSISTKVVSSAAGVGTILIWILLSIWANWNALFYEYIYIYKQTTHFIKSNLILYLLLVLWKKNTFMFFFPFYFTTCTNTHACISDCIHTNLPCASCFCFSFSQTLSLSVSSLDFLHNGQAAKHNMLFGFFTNSWWVKEALSVRAKNQGGAEVHQIRRGNTGVMFNYRLVNQLQMAFFLII